jgi:hypothetical protein
MPSPSPIKLSVPDAGFFLAVMAAAAAGAAYFHGRGTMTGVAACGFIAVMMAAAPALLAGVAKCPHCEAAVKGVPLFGGLKPYVRCVACRRYLRWEKGALAPLAADHLAEHAEFALPVDAVRSLPESCCVCLKPSSRVEDLVYTAAVRTPGLPTGKSMNFKVKAPYCEAHFGEARLAFEDLSAFPGVSPTMLFEAQEPDDHFVLKVRSYAFYRQAAGLN